MITRRTLLRSTALAAVSIPAAPALAAPTKGRAASRLTNLSHLKFLLDEVPLPALDGHSAFDGGGQGLAPWTYADRHEDGTFTPVGGGDHDPATGYWSQGAFNADDISRAAVVFLRAYTAFGDTADLETAKGLLRTLTYLQVDSGEHVGNVVLWQQVDGALNRSAIPIELPDPSDSDESYWLARTVWALGEGIAVFDRLDEDIVGALAGRLHLALDALDRASLGRYGEWETADGVRVPGWLITGGADASGEAVLGLIAARQALPDDARISVALDRYVEGITAMASGSVGQWPFGAILPWTGSQTFWHAWGGLAPAALALSGDPAAGDAAINDAGVFTPQVLTSGGPHNAWTPLPGEAQIAYGVHGRVAALIAASETTGGQGLRELAALTAGWFFGANPAGEQVYDPATGVTVDGIEVDGRVNRNSGAESTIHALLVMIALDEDAELSRMARRLGSTPTTRGMLWLPAEDAQLDGDASVVTPESAWTGESNWHGDYVLAGPDGTVRFTLSEEALGVVASGGATAHPLLHRLAEDAGTSAWAAIAGDGTRTSLGTLELGGAGDRGVTEWDGLLKPYALEADIPPTTVAIECVVDGRMELDELMILPAVTTAAFPTTEGGAITLHVATRVAKLGVEPGETGNAYTPDGRRTGPVNHGRRSLEAGQFAVVSS